MTTISRRFLVLAVLLFWQGGFLFYSSVVVPVGQDLLRAGHSAVSQGFITRQVTIYLNLAGAVAALPLLVDILAGQEKARWRRLLRLMLWAGLVGTLALLVWMHPRVDDFLNTEFHVVEDMKSFRRWHRAYLWTTTVQWALGVVYMAVMLWAWRDEDRAEGNKPGKETSHESSVSASHP